MMNREREREDLRSEVQEEAERATAELAAVKENEGPGGDISKDWQRRHAAAAAI